MSVISGTSTLRGYLIRGLFGRRPDLSFEIGKDEPTILTGSNGTGKSTVLRTIEAVGTGDWEFLSRVPFVELHLRFDKGPRLRIAQTDDGIKVSSGKREPWEYRRSASLRFAAQRRLVHLREAQRLMANSPEQVAALQRSLEDELSLFTFSSGVPEQPDPPDWLAEVVSKFKVLYITDQRLVINETPKRPDRPQGTEHVPTRTAVDAAAERLARVISRELARYAAESQRLDRDFPRRVVDAMTGNVEIADAELEALLHEVTRGREALQQVAILSEDPGGAGPLLELPLEDAGIKSVIWTVTEDTLQKLRVLEPLQTRLAAFTEFLNQHYRDKEVVIDQERGFRILVDGRQEVQPSQLSSGEQQILVLAHRVLFSAEPGTLILIDEPELSLHVLWQDSFIEDLTRMGKLRNLQFLMATHSPTLISGRQDLTRSLD